MRRFFIANIPLKKGFLWVVIRNNTDCSSKWKDKELILCWIYHGHSSSDNNIVHKLEFNKYSEFKKFKDLIKNNTT